MSKKNKPEAEINSRRNWMNTRLKLEMSKAAINMYYSESVIDYQRYGKQYYNILLGSLSGGGALYVMITSIFEEFAVPDSVNTLISILIFVIVGGTALMSQLSNIFFLKNDDFAKLQEFHSDYLIYLNQLEELYGWILDDSVATISIEKKFDELYKQYANKLTIASKLFGKGRRKWNNIAEDRLKNRIGILFEVIEKPNNTDDEKTNN